MLALLYAVSWLIVRNGQRLIDRQRLAQEQSNARERHWHREKMATLATMAANVAHEVGNPLAVIAALAQELPDAAGPGAPRPCASRRSSTQTGRIATMMRQIADFATARGQGLEWVDVNAMVKAVCDFQGFDFRSRGTPIEFVPQADLPACELVPDQLNEVLMSLLQAFAGGAPEAGATGADSHRDGLARRHRGDPPDAWPGLRRRGGRTRGAPAGAAAPCRRDGVAPVERRLDADDHRAGSRAGRSAEPTILRSRAHAPAV